MSNAYQPTSTISIAWSRAASQRDLLLRMEQSYAAAIHSTRALVRLSPTMEKARSISDKREKRGGMWAS